MPSAPIKFIPKQESGVDQLSGASPIAMNVVVDKKGACHRRPGLAESSIAVKVTGAPVVDGLYQTIGGQIYFTSEGSIYRVSAASAANMTTEPGIYDKRIAGGQRPVFAETEALLVITAGAEPQKIVLADNLTSKLGGPPSNATHVIANNSRLLTNDLSNLSLIQYSAQAAGSSYTGHETWNDGLTASYFSAEGRPDPIVALGENTGEVFAFGSTSFQVFSPDPQFVYAPGPTREFGCSAPYSVVKRDQAFAWLDHQRRFVVSDGRSFQVISDDIQTELDAMATVDDCFGYWVTEGVTDCFAWTFPSDGRTFVYYPGFGWGQWSAWTGANWSRFIVNAVGHSPTGGPTLFGTTDGRLGEFDQDTHTDFGEPIRAYIETGYEHRGTDALKHCKVVRFVLRRGENTTAPKARFGWRDAPGTWSGNILVDLGQYGDTEPVVEFRSLGTYRRRQWYFEFSSSEPLTLITATEEYEVLKN